MSLDAVSSATTKPLVLPGFANQPSRMANLSPAEQGKAVAGQFEAIMLRQFLQDSVGNMMGGKEAGPSGNVYGYLLTDTLATKLAEGGGLGLAKILQKQLTPRGAAAAATVASTPASP